MQAVPSVTLVEIRPVGPIALLQTVNAHTPNSAAQNVQSLVGVTTVTGTLPWVTMSLAGIAAVTCPAFTNVVVRPVPFQRTWDVPTKLLPFTVSVKAAPPAGVLVGASDVSAGFAGALIVNDKR